jgi:hypothetical protein
LEGSLVLPLQQKIPTQGHAFLDEDGGYRAQHSTGYRVEGILSFSEGHSQVAGNLSTKPEGGWCTLNTTVIKDLSVLEILTADKVVGQIITNHPANGDVPTVSFLGTRYENLRIAGYPVELKMNLDILGDKPANDASYTEDSGVLSRVSKQHESFRQAGSLPAEAAERYNQQIARRRSAEVIECSIVDQAFGQYPGYSHGNHIWVPEFGLITLGKLTVSLDSKRRTTVELTMIGLKLGCAIHAEVEIGSSGCNGVG